MTKKEETPPRPDPGAMMNKLTGMLESLGGIDTLTASISAGDRRSKLMNVKLTLIMEHLGIDKHDPRIEKYRLKKAKPEPTADE